MRDLENAATNLALAASQMEKEINARYLSLAKDFYAAAHIWPYMDAEDKTLEEIKKLQESGQFSPVQKNLIERVAQSWRPHIGKRNEGAENE